MSTQEQHALIKNIDQKGNIVLNRQLVSIILLAISLTATAITGFYRYDNGNKAQYASKEDVKILSTTVTTLSNSVTTLSNSVMVLTSQLKSGRITDSLNAVDIKNTVIYNKRIQDADLDFIKKELKLRISFNSFTETRDDKGNLIIHKYKN